jgi:FixJ family two-component response regulator
MQRRLQKEGYQVETFSSAQQLLDRRPDQAEPGCILLDVRLPGLSGPELQRRLNELGSTLPVVFITGQADISATVQALKAGADDFLTKPIQSDELVGAIERALARYENTREMKRALDVHHIRLASLTPRERQVFDLVVRGQGQQANRASTRNGTAHDQSPPPTSHGKIEGSICCRTCLRCHAAWGVERVIERGRSIPPVMPIE